MGYRQKVEQALRVRCQHLRTKAAFLGLPEAGQRENDVPTAVWWCTRTAEPLGPDGAAALPARCEGPVRPCYRPPLRPPSA